MAGVAAVVVTLALAGCAPATDRSSSGTDTSESKPSNPGGFSESKITLADGRIISCITWSTWDYFHEAMSSGLSCDWETPAPQE